jgi:hypothetical protein
VTESPLHDPADDARRSRTRRLTLLLALAATGVYAGFIVLQVLRAKG